MLNKTKISLIIGTALLLVGCIKDDNFDVVPLIEFQGFEVFKSSENAIDSAKFEFTFQDGDGDIGAIDSSEFNCFLIYEEKHLDSIITLSSVPNRAYSIPNLTPNAKDKNIEGVISLTIKPAPIYSLLNDSMYRYSCYVIDRANHYSDTISCNRQTKD